MNGILHAFEHWALNYRRTWHGSVFSSFVLPVLFLVSIGYGVGGYIDNTAALGGVSYVDFVAPGLLVSTGIQVVASDMSWPVFGALRWGSQYKAMQASPLTPYDMVGGHLLYGLLRSFSTMLVFLIVMGLFGVLDSPVALLAIVPAVLASAAIIGLIYSYTVSVDSESALSIVHRFGIVPLTLFSGVFFPLSQLPPYIEPIAWLSPLWHGAELARWAVTGNATGWWWVFHAGYLVALTLGGSWLAVRCLRRKLTV